jgi:tRNA A37 N6-isopentenylltransferase MiaA
LAIALLAEKKNQSIAEHIFEAENNQDNQFFSNIQKRLFYIYANKQDINEIIDMRWEQMVTKMGLFDEVLDYWEEIREFVFKHKSENPQDEPFEDILKIYNPLSEKSKTKIKQMYPITHSIGFLQSLEYLTTIKKINENPLNLTKGKMVVEKRKAAKKFLREFKTGTHKYTKMQHTWIKNQSGEKWGMQWYKILSDFSINKTADCIIDLISMPDSEYEEELNKEDQILTSFDRTGHPITLSFQNPPNKSPKTDDFEAFLSSQESQTTPKVQMYEPKSNILSTNAKLASFIVSHSLTHRNSVTKPLSAYHPSPNNSTII